MCVNSDGYNLQLRKIKNSVYKQIYIFPKTNQKKMLKISKVGLNMHSILNGDSFCMNYCFNAVWHGGDQPVALLSGNVQL